MAITYHKAVSDEGGAIGDEIFSGNMGTLIGQVSLAQQASGATISRKFFIANSGTSDTSIFKLSVSNSYVFTAILFESTGDSQVVGDLTGSEVDESPIETVIPALGHKSFWIQLDVPLGSTKTESYGSADAKQIKG